MKRGLTGTYTSSIAGGKNCQAFIPFPLPPNPELNINKKLQSHINEAMLALGRLDAISVLLPDVPDVKLFLYAYVRKEAVMSSQIEGTQSSLNDLMMYEIGGEFAVPMDDVQEVSCYVNALLLGVQRINEQRPITFRLLVELHEALMASGRGISRSPGKFRTNQVWIGGHSAEVATFVPPPALAIKDCWADLERFINDVPEATDPLIKAALTHVQFETIHPFMDGNGRLGRLLIPLILVEAKVLQQPLLYLSVFFKKHRETYYELLQQVRISGDWESWLLFFVDAVADTAQQAVATAKQLNDLKSAHKNQLLNCGRLAGSAVQVLETLCSQPIASIATLAERSNLASATVGKVIDQLVKLNIVHEVTGRKRNRIYAYTQYIAILNQD